LFGGRQSEKRDPREQFPRRGGFGGSGLFGAPLNQKSAIQFADLAAAHDRDVAITKDEIGRGNVTEMVIKRASSDPMVVNPALGPDMGLLLLAGPECQSPDQPGLNAAIPAKSNEQATLRPGVAGAGLEAFYRSHAGSIGARLVADLVVYVAEQGFKLIAFVRNAGRKLPR